MTTTHFAPSPPGPKHATPISGHAPLGNTTIRPVNESMKPKPLKPNLKTPAQVTKPDDQQLLPSGGASQKNDGQIHHRQAIPRRQVAPSREEALHTANPRNTSSRPTRGDKPYEGSDVLPVQKTTQSPESYQATHVSAPALPRTSRFKGESLGKGSATSAANAEDVADRAKNNTAETHVTETVAPGVTS